MRIIKGKNSQIEKSVVISGVYGEPTIIMGDNSYIGRNVNIAVPYLEIGDYVTIHHDSSISGQKECIIGHNSWVGEKSLLNTTGALWIGNNVGIGAATHIWTHIRHGELFEGCLLDKVSPAIIEDDVWLVGGYITVSQGLILGKKSVILTGSVVTKNTASDRIYAGTPAVDITSKIKPYKIMSVQDKMIMMDSFIREFNKKERSKVYREGAKIFLGKSEFDILSKTYNKKLSSGEIKFMQFLKGYRAKFIPKVCPIVGRSILSRILLELGK
ncbi:MAG: hypothetical protein WC980_06880 [Candidatus Brocadiia bacterium]